MRIAFRLLDHPLFIKSGIENNPKTDLEINRQNKNKSETSIRTATFRESQEILEQGLRHAPVTTKSISTNQEITEYIF